MQNIKIRLFSLLVLSILSTVSFAKNMTTIGHYQVNHIAYVSSFLSADIAKAFGVKRAGNSAVINISVQDVNKPGEGVEVTSIKGEVKNILQQVRYLDLQPVTSNGAVYYLDQYRFSNEDALTFTVEILLPGRSRPETIKWQQTLYTD